MAASVEILSMEFVRPSSHAFHRQPEIKFSLIDQVLFSMGGGVVFVYENQAHSTEIGSVRKSQLLKQSLSVTLTKLYPFAGRINGSCSVICDDSGVLFVQAKVHSTLSEALQQTDPDETGRLLLPRPLSTDLTRNCVPMIIQVSNFQCGGMAIGFSISHAIADGWTLGMFFTSWAATCRGEEVQMDNGRFDIGSELFPPLDAGFQLNIHNTLKKNNQGKEIVKKKFVFDKEMIATLKQLASSEVENPTRVELVSAFVWKHMFETLRLRHGKKTRFVASVAVDLRKRLRPPVSDFALGNFVVPRLVSLKRDMEIDYGVLVGEFRNTTKGLNEKYYAKYLFDYVQFISKPEVWACVFSSWSALPFNALDFGWGGPILVSPETSVPSVHISSTSDGQAIEVWIHLPQDDMCMLPTDLLSLPTAQNDSPPKTFSRL